MKTKENWLTIIGGGLSGLSLAGYLSENKLLPGRVKIFERRKKYTDDRTFCFWENFDKKDPLVSARFGSWSFSKGICEIRHEGTKYCYAMVRSIDFYEHYFQILDSHPQIEIIMNAEIEPESCNSQIIIDTTPPQITRFSACQSFLGEELYYDHGIATNNALIMGDMDVCNDGFRFVYRLPITEKRILVEQTIFGKQPADFKSLGKQNSEWKKKNGFNKAKIIRTEKAVIPMGLSGLIENKDRPDIIKIGASFGMTRSSSGYGFQRIRGWCQKAAQCLIEGKPMPDRNLDHFGIKWMDDIFLRIVKSSPDTLPEIFLTMAGNMKPDDFSGFMTSPNLRNALSMVAAVPKGKFLQAAVRQIF